MTRTVADSVAEGLLDAFPPERAYARADFQEEHFPAPIAHFLRHLLTDRIERDIAEWQANRPAWVDYGAEEVQQAQERLIRVAGEHAQIPASAWEETLRHAARQVTAYLAQPQATLRRFVFSESEKQEAARIRRRLQYFSEYDYLKRVLTSYLERKQLQAMEQERFAALIKRIDREMVADYDPHQWIRLLQPLFDLTAHLPRAADRAVPVPLLQAFFEEKEAEDVTKRLRQAKNAKGLTALSKAELRQLLEAAPAASTSEEKPPAEPTEPRNTSPDEPMPLWKKFQHGTGGTPRKKGEGPTPSPERSRETGEAQPRWKQFRSGASPSSPTSDELGKLEREVLGERGAKNRSFYVKNLFDGDEDAYRRVLRRLRRTTAWSEASQIIAEDIFRKHKVNIYSDAAVSFTDAVQNRFR